MKRNLLILGSLFAITLALIFGFRMSADALAVIIGVILGIVASVPTTLLVTFFLNRQRHEAEKLTPYLPQQPPVVIVTPQNPAQPYHTPLPTLSPSPKRTFTIVGEESTE